jgi:phosphohistidine phosphatase SixA
MVLSCGQQNSKKNKDKSATKSELTTYYFIRHAEKDRSDTTNPNPGLTEVGIARAKNWASFFDSIPLDQIFSTEYKRTQQTASYTASNQNLMVEGYDASDLYSEDFQTLTKGQAVLVVGHSNTTPMFVNAILKQNAYPPMDDNNNATLYKVMIKNEVANVKVMNVD